MKPTSLRVPEIKGVTTTRGVVTSPQMGRPAPAPTSPDREGGSKV